MRNSRKSWNFPKLGIICNVGTTWPLLWQSKPFTLITSSGIIFNPSYSYLSSVGHLIDNANFVTHPTWLKARILTILRLEPLIKYPPKQMVPFFCNRKAIGRPSNPYPLLWLSCFQDVRMYVYACVCKTRLIIEHWTCETVLHRGSKTVRPRSGTPSDCIVLFVLLS